MLLMSFIFGFLKIEWIMYQLLDFVGDKHENLLILYIN